MREKLPYLIARPWMEIKGFAVATAIGLMARCDEKVNGKWVEDNILEAAGYGPLGRFRRWSLLFLCREDRRNAYKRIDNAHEVYRTRPVRTEGGLNG